MDNKIRWSKPQLLNLIHAQAEWLKNDLEQVKTCELLLRDRLRETTGDSKLDEMLVTLAHTRLHFAAVTLGVTEYCSQMSAELKNNK